MKTQPGVASCLLAVLLPLASLHAPLVAQEATAAVHGRVLAAATREPLRDVLVRVLGTDRAVLTDAEGGYRIPSLQSGLQSLAFEMLGYRPRVLSVALVAGETASLDAALATQALGVEAIVVTAQKRQQPVEEVPVSITVYEGEFLRATGIGEVDALAAYVPGLEVQVQSPNTPGFVVRGITSDESDPRAEARVSVFQDGVSISRSQASVVELFDMERVEVLKGPQGTLFGRAAEIGALHLIQQKPTPVTAAELTAGSGNFGQRSASGFANAPLVENRLYGRVAGVYRERDGYVENGAGGALNGAKTAALRGSLRWVPAELTRLDLIANWQHDTPGGVAFLGSAFVPAPGMSAASYHEGFLGGDDRFPPLGIDRQVWGATLLADQVLDPRWTLQGIAAYRSFDSYEVFDADGTSAPALNFAEDAAGEQASLELRALFAGRRLNGFVGVSGFYQEASQRVPFSTDPRNLLPLLSRVLSVASQGAFPEIPFIVAGQPVFVPAYPPELAALYPQLEPYVGQPIDTQHGEERTSDARNTSFDIFADGTLALSGRLHLTAGLRGTFEKLRSGYRVPAAEPPSPLGFALGSHPNVLFAPTPGGARIAHAATFSAVVGRLAADLALRDDLHVFASYGRGRRPPVIQQDSTAAEFEVLNAERVNSYEAGVKGAARNGRLQYDAAAFYYDYHDFQMNVEATLTPSGIKFRSDQAEATGYGGELSLQAALGERLSVFGNYAYLHTAFDERAANGKPQPLAGNTFRLTPKHSFSAGLGYTAPIARFGELFLRPSYTWKSRVYFEEGHQGGTVLDQLAPPLRQDAYGLLNVRAGLRADRGRVALELWGANLLDEDYLLDAGNTGLNFYVPTYVPGPPRLYGIQVTVRR